MNELTLDKVRNELDNFVLSLREDFLAKKTYNKYKADVRKFIKFAEERSLNKITKLDLIDYRDYLTNGNYELSSINSFITGLNKYIYFLGYEGMYIKTLKVQKKTSLNNVLSSKDFKRLLAYSKKMAMEALKRNDWRSNEMYRRYMEIHYMMRVFGYTGIRVNELQFFTVETVKSRKRVIRVTNKGKTRDVPIKDSLKKDLHAYMKEFDIKEGYLFKAQRNPSKPVRNDTIWKKFKKVAGRAKVKLDDVYPHSFRHMFAKRYLKLHPGCYAELAHILGHNKIETTALYTHLSEKEQKNEADEFEY